MRRPEVVFSGHDATRTGAPLMFLYFLRWVRANTDLAFEIVLLDGGPLEEDFRALGRVRVLGDLRDRWWSRRLEALRLRRLASRVRGVAARLWCWPLRRVPTVYCNSLVGIRVVQVLGGGPRTVISHVHELEGGLGVPAAAADLRLLLDHTDHFVAASELVRDNLIRRHDVAPERVTRHYEFIDVAAFDAQLTGGESPDDIRAELGIPPEAFVVGAVGVTEARKGPDLFLLLATVLRHRDLGRPIHLVWLGGDPDADATRWLRHDIEKAGLSDLVHLVPPRPRPAPWFRLFDVYVLTSREDPFPLVCLESSLLERPVVCFDNTGIAEFVGDGECGYVVPYLDVEAMADRVVALLDDPDTRGAVGRRAAEKVRAEFDVGAGAPPLWADLDRWRRE